MQPITAQRLIEGTRRLASLPSIYEKIDTALDNPTTSNSTLAKIIRIDPALSTKLLQLANSAFYGSKSKILEIDHAIAMIGQTNLRAIVLSCTMVNLFTHVPENLITMKSFWLHGITCGLVARSIAKCLGDVSPERFFIGGLIHDIGKLILLTEMPTVFTKMVLSARKKKILMWQMEDHILGFNHSNLGGLLLKEWRLPPRLQEMAQSHHSPLSAEFYLEDAIIMHVSDIIANALMLGSSGEYFVPPLIDKTWSILKLETRHLDIVIKETLQQYKDTVKIILS